MPDREPIALCWSGGKDSSLAWYALRGDDRYRIEVLVTTMTETYDRVSMHGVRRSLIEAQAEALGLPLETVWIPPKADNLIYETRMANTFQVLEQSQGIRTVAFGDIFLEDLKVYREKQFGTLGMNCLFPLWKRDTKELAREFLDLGFRGVTVCIDPKSLSHDFVGRNMDEAFFDELPESCDPCGENGEFHSFVYHGPDWRCEIPITKGEIVQRDSFLFCDLLPLNIDTVSPTE
jgi:uncharacterized protein (TIGR00290 family)